MCAVFQSVVPVKRFFPFLHLIYCWEAYTTGFNNDLNKLFSFPGTLRLLGSFTILCSLLVLQNCLSWAHIKGIEFLNCCLIFSKEEEKRIPLTILCTKKSPPDISHTHHKKKRKTEVYFIKEEKRDVLSLTHVCLSWIDRWDRSSNLTFSAFSWYTKSIPVIWKFAFTLRWWPMASRHSEEIIDKAESKLGIKRTQNPFHFWHCLPDNFVLIQRGDLGS